MKTILRQLALLLLLVVAGLPVADRVAAQTKSQAQRPTSTPYAGDLSIFEYADRDEKLHVKWVMDSLRLKPGMSVADIGAGSGWFTVRAAARVAPGGVVYAEDINPEAINSIRERAKRENLGNVQTILGAVDDTKLPANSVDAVLILKTYHEFAKPVPLMKQLKAALRPGARVGIIDRNGNGTDHGIMPDIVEQEMKQAGYKRVEILDFTKTDGQDYFLIFQVN